MIADHDSCRILEIEGNLPLFDLMGYDNYC